MSTDIDIQGLDDVQAVIKAIVPAIDASLMAIAEEARDRIAPYPAPRRQKQAFKTAKQRRGFFAKLRKGQITVPYRRTDDALNRWGQPVKQERSVALRNTSPHARWVHSSKQQASYHKGNWKTDEGVAEEIMSDGTAAKIIEQALQHAIGDANG